VTNLLIVVGVFIVMEPLTYLAHRYVMHGIAWTIHASHHRPRETTIELNDLFPVFFATITIIAFAIGTNVPSASVLIPIGIGVTAYGALYSFVHDVYIHGRFFQLTKEIKPLEYLKRAHILHHLYDGEPYGMLMPVVPKRIREQAKTLFGEHGELRDSRDLLKTGNFRAADKYVVID
jgi:beta-carotene 3-hydroxylase